MLERTAHIDTFSRDHLPPEAEWPLMDFACLPELAAYPRRMNCARELLDKQAARYGERPVLRYNDEVWTYNELLAKANRIARVLVDDLGVRPGNRVLLRSPNNPMYVACWFAVMKVGAIAVATMPLYRSRELIFMADKAEIAVALCDWRLREEMAITLERSQHLKRATYFYAEGPDSLEARMATKVDSFATVDTAWDDVCLIAFTSGTTGPAKGCMHFGLGALVTFPMHVGASTVLVEQFTPEKMLETIQTRQISVLFTAPTAYRAMTELAKHYDLRSLTKCVSAGETLPLPVWRGWFDATALRIIDGIGSTEMLHIFIGCAGDEIRPGATGRAIPGFQAKVVDEGGNDVAPGTIGRLAVRGPTGCRYLANPERQAAYVRDGWNLTGDAYKMDADGYFWYQARTDDMIVSAGYNISGAEIEAVLLEHPKVLDCAVIGAPDAARGHIVKAYVVLRDKATATDATIKDLQDFVKAEVAPYKYPRAIEFIDALPRTPTGKVQRVTLRERVAGKSS
jgi:2-aminobenzoate-CoA ligase